MRLARWLPALVELALVGAAIAWLLPLFARIAPLDPGRDQRFLDRGLAVAGLPDPVVPATQGAKLSAALSEAGVPGRVEIAPGTAHGLVGEENRKATAETFRFLDRYLRQAGR